MFYVTLCNYLQVAGCGRLVCTPFSSPGEDQSGWQPAAVVQHDPLLGDVAPRYTRALSKKQHQSHHGLQRDGHERDACHIHLHR